VFPAKYDTDTGADDNGSCDSDSDGACKKIDDDLSEAVLSRSSTKTKSLVDKIWK
jgi:hypothetical protein